MRISIAVLVLMFAGGAGAQPAPAPPPAGPPAASGPPGATPPVAPQPYAPPVAPQPYAPPPGAPQPYAPPPGAPQPYVQPYAPPPYAYRPRVVQLTPEEQELLQRGPISDGQIIGGGAVAILFGFGLGQAVEGRWHDTGWIFTLGESGSMVVMFTGLAQGLSCFENCENNGSAAALLVGGAIALVGFRAWELVDVFIGPAHHNQRLRTLRARLGYPPDYAVAPYLAPVRGPHGTGGGVAGVTLRF